MLIAIAKTFTDLFQEQQQQKHILPKVVTKERNTISSIGDISTMPIYP